jgi:Na+/H+-dicarboxylate symporter
MAPAPSTKTGNAMFRVVMGVLASAHVTPVTVATVTVSQTGNSLIAGAARCGTSAYSAVPLTGNALARLIVAPHLFRLDARNSPTVDARNSPNSR